ncbi:MAG TPA: hypothetical protein DEP84_22490 [Chloroflexi bacterium]|nr:hypothetical protein [Chloroflexota bacterium]
MECAPGSPSLGGEGAWGDEGADVHPLIGHLINSYDKMVTPQLLGLDCHRRANNEEPPQPADLAIRRERRKRCKSPSLLGLDCQIQAAASAAGGSPDPPGAAIGQLINN